MREVLALRLALGLAVVGTLAVSCSGPADTKVYEGGPGLEMPKPIQEVKPDEGDLPGERGFVWLQAIVGTDGKARAIEVIKSLGPERDRRAIAALERWEFAPGRLDGRAVPVRVTVEMRFGGEP